jgi:hypothetical protein
VISASTRDAQAAEETRRSARSRDPWLACAYAVPLVAFAIYLAISLRTLFVAHPAEDAYILFHYVENVAGGRGIVFNAGGPHAEGATDFLWLALLSLLAKLGINVAVAAAIANACGAAAASFVCVETVRRAGCRGPCALVLALLSLSVVGIAGALASTFGFSAMAYSALAVLVLHVALEGGTRALIAVPLLGLTLGLFRPDGVVLGVAFTLIGLALAARDGVMRVYVRSALAALVIGAAYFVWRYRYFGLVLPLPLYVKSNARTAIDLTGALAHPRSDDSGFDANVVWMTSALGPLPLAAFAIVAATAARVTWSRARTLLLLLAPSALLIGALCFARQTQNFGFRFQAPITLSVFYAAFWCLAQLCARWSSCILRALACAALVAILWPMFRLTAIATTGTWKGHSYMDTFPAAIAPVLRPGRVIALTDAGRIPYWTDARVVDVVGLNTPSAALSPPSIAELEALSPDMVMFNTSKAFNITGPPNKDVRMIELTPEMLESSLAPECRVAFDGGPPPAGVFGTRENLAPARLGRLLVDGEKYIAYAVAYGRGLAHVWGFKRDLEELPMIVDALRRTTSGEEYHSYLELIDMRAIAKSEKQSR